MALTRHKPLRRTGLPARRRPVVRVNRERKASELLRCFGPPERRAWVVAQPCAVCARQPTESRPHQNAHVTDDGTRGMSRRSGYACIVSLCAQCHADEHRWGFPPDTYRELAEAAADTETLWLAHVAAANPQAQK